MIINTASVAAEDGQIGQAAYSASKGGVLAMALPVARDLMNEGVRVNTILPGIFKTPMMDDAAQGPAVARRAVPFPKRLGKPEEYAALAMTHDRARLFQRRRASVSTAPFGWRRVDLRRREADFSKTLSIAVAARPGRRSSKLSRRGFEVETKSTFAGDRSRPRRRADHPCRAGLAAPGVPVIAEEEVAAGRIPAHGETYFLVDPLDGTKEFIRGGDDYTVNIGLIAAEARAWGWFMLPQPAGPRRDCRAGAWVEEGGGRRPIALPSAAARHRVAVASKSHFFQPTAEYLEAVGAGEHVSIGSSLKFCIVAEGPRRHLSAPVADQRVGHGGGPCGAARRGRAGRRARRVALVYGKPAFLNRGFVATGGLASASDRTVPGSEFSGGGELPQGV